MSSAEMFDEALQIGLVELDALIDGNVELAESCCLKREKIMQQALSLDELPNQELRARLLKMQDLQKQLVSCGTELKRQLQAELSQGKHESKRIRGYQQVVRMAT